jgi:hypothetical protein
LRRVERDLNDGDTGANQGFAYSNGLFRRDAPQNGYEVPVIFDHR